LSQLIKNAKLCWNENGEPSAELFDDLYFSTDDGLDESHYVFIEQNKLAQRWQSCQAQYYVIAETGFGSGLNFLATWQFFIQWRGENPDHPLTRLYFTSFEKYPLTASDLASAHQRWPTLSPLANALRGQYPSAIAGCHRHQFDVANNATVILDLWLGDINDTLPNLHYSGDGLVDCWFLDGFSPSKNPEMWNDTLYNNMAKCSKANATLATFTASGNVRRGLAGAGFSIKKVKGYGRKREMITATFNKNHAINSQTTWYHRQLFEKASMISGRAITIIGGGIASATLALALVKRGLSVTVICQDGAIAQGASGNRQGGFYPLLNANHDQLSQFYCQAFGVAKNIYQPFVKAHPECGDFCGVLQLAHDERQQQRQQALINSGYFPTDMVNTLTTSQMNAFAGVAVNCNGLVYPQAGWISPLIMTQVLFEQAASTSKLTLICDTNIVQLASRDNCWLAISDDQQQFECHELILANGHQLTHFDQTNSLPMYATAGQVSHVPSTIESTPLRAVLCYQGYITPALNNSHCVGASFERDINNTAVSSDVSQQNIDKLHTDTQRASWATSLEQATTTGKVGVRMSVKDHLPMVGNVPDYAKTLLDYADLAKGKPATAYNNSPICNNLYMIGGLGSRGITSAPLLAEILTAQITGEPQPISQPMLNKLNPNRYWVKQLKRGIIPQQSIIAKANHV